MSTRTGSALMVVVATTLLSSGCATHGDFTLTSLDGQSVSLSKQKGKVVLLTFWGSQ